jgi:hypothetical protein
MKKAMKFEARISAGILRNARFPALVVMLLFALVSGAYADSIPVGNPSFETLPAGWPNVSCGGSCAYSIGLPIPDWNSTGFATGQWTTGGFAGNPPAIDGSVLAYTNGGTISQDVGSAVPGVTYSLQVDVLHRTDVALTGVVQLEIGGLVVATAPVVDGGPGTWSNWTAVDTATAADAGKTITILLSANSEQGDFDNVRLNSSPAVPEPGSCVLLGTGLVLVTGRLRRKARSQ